MAVKTAALDGTYVSMGSRRLDSVHEYYRYPARFSPSFARAVIAAFSRLGEVVLDPFVGGGTTLVEARLLSRISIGADISSLATFVSRAKTLVADDADIAALRSWAGKLLEVRLKGPTPPASPWQEQGYLRGLGQQDTWRIRDFLIRILDRAHNELPTDGAELLGRCAVLRTAQWALDMRSSVPAVDEFRESLHQSATRMADVSEEFGESVRASDARYSTSQSRTTVVQQGLPGLVGHQELAQTGKASLVVTSPPYPGVYVLYHRWKLQGRQEIPTPFWLTASPDGNGMAHYTMSARARQTLDTYFAKMETAIAEIAALIAAGGWLVQLIGFSDVEEQLPRYLAILEQAGFQEALLKAIATDDDGRLWRTVPSRRWWVTVRSRSGVASHTAQEVVLVHRRVAQAG